MPKKYVVCRVSELPPGSRKIIQAGKRSIGVFNIHGEYHALLNVCPHQLAPLCKGRITGTTEAGPVGEYRWVREGEIIRCPWHGWEFDIKTGRSVFNPHRVRTHSYPVTVERDESGGEETEDPCVETFPVGVEEASVVVTIP